MNNNFEVLVHRHLDGLLSEAETAELGRRVECDPQAARLFAQLSMLHDRMSHLLGEPAPELAREPRGRPVRSGRGRWGLAGLLAASAALGALALFWPGAGRLGAASTLERLMEASASLRDRTYVITDLDPGQPWRDSRQPPIGGAILHVRQPGSFVLIRSFPDGRKYVTGSDGDRNWSVPPEGTVRVSADPLRFRWPLPGHVHGIPFVDPRSDLEELGRAYHLTLPASGSGELGLLRADKKDRPGRGPTRVDLWFRPQTGVIQRMVFEGLPRERGGPRSVAVELAGQKDLGEGFFRHEAHHGPGRAVEEED